MRIGLVFDIKEDYKISNDDVSFLDFNYLSDMEYLQNSLESEGHNVTPIGAPHEFARQLRMGELPQVDIIMNFGEGFLSRNREGIVPALCEINNIPYTGSDAFAMVLTLDKHLTLLFAESIGLHTPNGFLYQFDQHTLDSLPNLMQKNKVEFPVVVKPNREGTSMGLSLAQNYSEMRRAVTSIVEKYKQDVRCDTYIGGNEIAVPIIGTGDKAYALGIVEYCEIDGSIMPFYTAEKKEHGKHRTIMRSFGAKIDEEIIRAALRIHRSLGCCDISRIDMKLWNDTPFILEVTPIPSMNRGGTFEMCAIKHGITYGALLNRILHSALERYKLFSN